MHYNEIMSDTFFIKNLKCAYCGKDNNFEEESAEFGNPGLPYTFELRGEFICDKCKEKNEIIMDFVAVRGKVSGAVPEVDSEKDFDAWNKRKKQLHKSTFNDYIHAREVWWCALGVNIGVEADGKHENFERPVLVIRKFNQDSVLIVPLTSRSKQNPYHISFTHEGEEFSAVISQMRLISTNRLLRWIYKMDTNIFKMIQASICEVVFQMPITNRPPLARGSRWPHGRK